MTPTRFTWLGGRPALDLCNTAWAGVELLNEPDDLVRWLGEARLGIPDSLPTEWEVESTRRLRAALRTGLLAGEAGSVADIVGDWLRETPGRLAVDRATLRPTFCPEVATCGCLLVPALLDAVDLARDDLDRVRECAAVSCPIVYLDTSRNRSRRWCSMERCGARAKSTAYYARKRGTAR